MVPGSCGDPGAPVNGDRVLTSTTTGATVEYSCTVGYRLNGVDTRTCMDNQEWSGELPACVCKDGVKLASYTARLVSTDRHMTRQGTWGTKCTTTV